jgi:hypothetical protein
VGKAAWTLSVGYMFVMLPLNYTVANQQNLMEMERQMQADQKQRQVSHFSSSLGQAPIDSFEEN